MASLPSGRYNTISLMIHIKCVQYTMYFLINEGCYNHSLVYNYIRVCPPKSHPVRVYV